MVKFLEKLVKFSIFYEYFLTHDGRHDWTDHALFLGCNDHFKSNVGNIGHQVGDGVGQAQVEDLDSCSRNETSVTGSCCC